jgi:hypothetical protein
MTYEEITALKIILQQLGNLWCGKIVSTPMDTLVALRVMHPAAMLKISNDFYIYANVTSKSRTYLNNVYAFKNILIHESLESKIKSFNPLFLSSKSTLHDINFFNTHRVTFLNDSFYAAKVLKTPILKLKIDFIRAILNVLNTEDSFIVYCKAENILYAAEILSKKELTDYEEIYGIIKEKKILANKVIGEIHNEYKFNITNYD